MGRPYYQAHQRPLEIEKSDRFLRALRKLPADVQAAWRKVKLDLENGIWKGTKFGRLRGHSGQYAARVGLRYRAPLENSRGNTFVAIDLRSREGAYK